MIRFPFHLPKPTPSDYRAFAAVLALDAVLASVFTVWALVSTLGGNPRASWWVVGAGVVVASGAAAGALRFRRRAAQVQTGGAQ